MGRLNPSGTAGFEEFSQAFVFEAPYHTEKCNLCRIRCQRWLGWHITPGSRAGLELRSSGKSVAVQPMVKPLICTLPCT